MSHDCHGAPAPLSFRRVRVVVLVSLLACSAPFGCGPGKDARVTPTATARQSLEAALNAWQNGQAAGKIEATSPPVQVADSVWLKGRKLQSYEILSEDTEADGLRWFSVRLNLDKPGGSEVVRYVVMGRSPVWVYRQEDYKRSQDWQGYK